MKFYSILRVAAYLFVSSIAVGETTEEKTGPEFNGPFSNAIWTAAKGQVDARLGIMSMKRSMDLLDEATELVEVLHLAEERRGKDHPTTKELQAKFDQLLAESKKSYVLVDGQIVLK